MKPDPPVAIAEKIKGTTFSKELRHIRALRWTDKPIAWYRGPERRYEEIP